MGGCVTDALRGAGYHVTVYDNLVYETRFFKEVPFVRGDVRDRTKLAPLLKTHDVVVALAAIVGDAACDLNPDITRAVNVASLRSLARSFSGKIIFASSCSVYGASSGIITEESALRPLTRYAKTKVEAERDLLRATRDNRHVIFRFGTLFGFGDVHTRVRFDLVANAFTKNAVSGEPLRVFGGGRWRPLLHVCDAAGAVLFALEHNLSGVYNVSHQNYMVKDIAQTVRETLSDLTVKIEYNNLKVEDLRDYRVSSEKLRAAGWRSRRDLGESVAELRAKIREGRIKDLNDRVYSNELFLKSHMM